MTTPTRARVRLLILVGSAALLLAVPVRAQHVATSFEEVRGQVEPGETIYVTDTSGVTVKGNLVRLSTASLEVRVRRDGAAPPLRLSERDVNNIVVERFDSWWNGALIGLAGGAVPGLLIELAGRSEYEKFSGAGALGLGSIGLITGLLIDVLNKEKVTVYVHTPTPQSRDVNIVPLLSTSVTGVQLCVGF